MAIIGLVPFVGVVVFGVLFAIAVLKGGSLKLPTIGMAACFILTAAIAALIQFGIGPFEDGTADEGPEPLGVESQGAGGNEAGVVESEQPVDDDGTIKPGSYVLPCGMRIQFFDSVRNDVTKRWRYSATSDSYVPADYALEYYNEMFSSDDEIHGIWNATLGTMTCVKMMSGLLFVDTYEYVDGEEHDAKLMFSGMLLDSKIIDKETGEPFEG